MVARNWKWIRRTLRCCIRWNSLEELWNLFDQYWQGESIPRSSGASRLSEKCSISFFVSLICSLQTIPTPDYVHLHVTLLVTNASHPAPAYFGRGKADDVPTTILTSASAVRRASQDKDTSKSNQVWDLNPFGRKKREEIRKREPKLEVSFVDETDMNKWC